MQSFAATIFLLFTLHGIYCFMKAVFNFFEVPKAVPQDPTLGEVKGASFIGGKLHIIFVLSDHGMSELQKRAALLATIRLSLGANSENSNSPTGSNS